MIAPATSATSAVPGAALLGLRARTQVAAPSRNGSIHVTSSARPKRNVRNCCLRSNVWTCPTTTPTARPPAPMITTRNANVVRASRTGPQTSTGAVQLLSAHDDEGEPRRSADLRVPAIASRGHELELPNHALDLPAVRRPVRAAQREIHLHCLAARLRGCPGILSNDTWVVLQTNSCAVCGRSGGSSKRRRFPTWKGRRRSLSPPRARDAPM